MTRPSPRKPVPRRPERASCYAFEFSYPPGAARLAEVFVYRRLEHIRRCIEQRLLAPDLDPHLLPLMVRGTVALWVIQRGVLRAGLDARAVLRLQHDGRGAALDDPAVVAIGHALLTSSRPALQLSMDWESVEAWAPPLEAPLATPGARVPLSRGRGLPQRPGSYVCGAKGIARALRYGFTDLEGNANSPPCAFVDPDPAPDALPGTGT